MISTGHARKHVSVVSTKAVPGIPSEEECQSSLLGWKMEGGKIISGASFSIHYRKITPTIPLPRSGTREMPVKVLASFVGFSSLGFNSRVSSPSFSMFKIF